MTRPARLFRLTHMLAGRRSWGVTDLARELGMARRTIYRDLNELSACGIPVYHDGHGYRLLDDARTPTLKLNAAERAVLVLALGNPVIERQASLAPALKTLRDKLHATSAAMVEAPQAMRLASIDRSGSIPDEIGEILEQAIRANRQVRILYQSLSSGGERWRSLDPYEVFHRGEAWYTVGHCHVNDELRTFRLDRIARARLKDSHFIRPLDFRLDRYIEDSWSVYHGSDRWNVVVHFDPVLGPLIDNARHHPGERKRRLPSGQIEYRVRVNHLDEIARWIVSFEGKARAIEPAELCDRVSELAAAVVVAHRRPARKVGKRSGRSKKRSDVGEVA